MLVCARVRALFAPALALAPFTKAPTLDPILEGTMGSTKNPKKDPKGSSKKSAPPKGSSSKEKKTRRREEKTNKKEKKEKPAPPNRLALPDHPRDISGILGDIGVVSGWPAWPCHTEVFTIEVCGQSCPQFPSTAGTEATPR